MAFKSIESDPIDCLRGEGKPLASLQSGVSYYNSNSYSAGLLIFAGYEFSNIPDPPYFQPGLGAPVPLGIFND